MKKSSSKKGSSKRRGGNFLPIFVLVACFLVALGGGWYVQQMNILQARIVAQKKLEAAQIQAKKEKEEARKKRREEIQALFDTYLNAFQSELVHKANIYKKTRRLLRDIIRPNNFKTTEFSKENYELFKESLLPSLREESADMIAIFERYSDQIEKELSGDGNDLQKFFLTKWKEMTKEQLNTYVDFFAREEEMLQAYDDLITYYYTHSKRYVVDEETNTFVFADPGEEAKAKALLERALELQKPVKEKDEDVTE